MYITKKQTFIGFLIVVALQSASAAERPLSLNIAEQWSNIFAGKETIFHVTVTAGDQFKGRVGWGFASSGATLARGENEVSAEPGKIGTLEVRLQPPEVKEGVILQASLSVSVYPAGHEGVLTNLTRTLWIFHEDPLSYRREWLEKLDIHLFDPEKKTAELFADAKVPFKRVGNIDALVEIKEGILIIGEGVSLRDYRGLARMMTKTAASGTPVLCLAPAGGEMIIPGTGDVDFPQPRSMSFRRNDIIKHLDKRLDADAWPPDGKVVAGSVKLVGEKGPVVVEIEKGGDDWPWVEMDFSDKRTKLIICGFGIVEKWGDSPTPRFLFGKLLEYMARDGVRAL